MRNFTSVDCERCGTRWFTAFADDVRRNKSNGRDKCVKRRRTLLPTLSAQRARVEGGAPDVLSIGGTPPREESWVKCLGSCNDFLYGAGVLRFAQDDPPQRAKLARFGHHALGSKKIDASRRGAPEQGECDGAAMQMEMRTAGRLRREPEAWGAKVHGCWMKRHRWNCAEARRERMASG